MKHQTRTLKELYVILLDSYLKVQNDRHSRKHSYFICNHIGELASNNIITAKEKIKLLSDFQSQRPTKNINKEFYDNPKFYKLHLTVSWWKYTAYSVKGIKEKVKFLEHLISIQLE